MELVDSAETIATAAEISLPRTIGDTPFCVVPDAYTLHDLEKLLPTPTRARGTVPLHDVASFIAYAQRHNGTGMMVYASVEPPNFVAVLNDHHPGDDAPPGWRDHRAVYACPKSHEWLTWTAQNGKAMTQEQFAQFIEDNLPDIAKPPAAEMLEISRTLEAKKKVNFSSGIRLANGESQLTYEEQIQGTAAKGQIAVPETFTIGIPVLEGGPKYAVEARLRYRIVDGGKLSMWFDLLRPHKILEDAVKEVWAAIEAGLEKTILRGKPE